MCQENALKIDSIIIMGSPRKDQNTNEITKGGWHSRLSGKNAIVVSVCAGASREDMGFTTEAMLCDRFHKETNNDIKYNG